MPHDLIGPFDIIIVNWNAGPQLGSCVASIANAIGNELALGKLVIVDNASTDGSLVYVESCPLPTTIIRNAVNMGFGAACNQGIAASSSPLVVFLNPDTIVTFNSLAGPLAFLSAPENKHYAACGIQLVDENGRVARSCARLPTAKSLVLSSLGIAKLFPGKAWDIPMTDWDHMANRDVDHVIGAAYFVRRNVMDLVGGFDERYFVYLEDLDLSKRIGDAGYTIHYLATVQAFHKGGGTSQKVAGRRLYYALRARLQYAVKHFTRVQALAVFGVTLLVEPLSRVLQSVVFRSRASFHATVEAYRLLLPDISSIWLNCAHQKPKVR